MEGYHSSSGLHPHYVLALFLYPHTTMDVVQFV